MIIIIEPILSVKSFKMYGFLYLIIFNIVATSSHSDDSFDSPSWYYPSNGIERWPAQCSGKMQSPIDFLNQDLNIGKAMKFKFDSYNKLTKFTLKNNGYTVKMQVDPSEAAIYLAGGDIFGKYLLQEIHFHWPSEHRINGTEYPLEAHFVHTLEKYEKYTNRSAKKLHVLGVLFYITKTNNLAFGSVFSSLSKLSNIGETDTLKLKPRVLLPLNTDEFYRYSGSLTTPNCDEIVRWTVFRSMIPISSKQYDLITKIKTFNGTNSQNNRKTQPINGRELFLLQVDSKASSKNNLKSVFLVSILIFFKHW